MADIRQGDNGQRWTVEHGDCRALLKAHASDSFDSCVNDIPYELGFMSRAWDRSGIAFDVSMWAEVLRVLKPGAHLLVFGGTRTMHRIACAVEDAGFQCRDYIEWAYGSGFPKSHNLPGGLGTALKPAHEPIYLFRKPLEKRLTVAQNVAKWGTGALNIDACRVSGIKDVPSSAGTRNLAELECGWGIKASADRDGMDPNVGRWPPNLLLTHSAACKRIGTTAVKANPTWDTPNRDTAPSAFTGETVSAVKHGDDAEDVAVWECREDCPVRLMDQQSGDLRARGNQSPTKRDQSNGVTGWGVGPAGPLDPGDSGTASRFFPQFEWTDLDDLAPFYYCAKASRGERDRGLEAFRERTATEAQLRAEASIGSGPRAGTNRNGGARNTHPTVKPEELLRYLCRLVTPAGGLVLDHTCGAGTTGVAAVREGYRFVGMELNDTDEEPFATIARARIAHVVGGDFELRDSLRAYAVANQLNLFGGVA